MVVAIPFLLPAGVSTLLLCLGFGWQASTYATAAPLLGWLAARDLRQSTLPTAPTGGADTAEGQKV
ncbi:hypothetical protein [Fodinicola feengrottensis]|uniref:hypothetical protein n=1 Tax=Fodinicola feengrottensis TaxID=435914 RepID=UPI0013CFF6B5|nr:hypothetical protein [Fodinicola feengrottensis]